jgi:hypothetical protein
MTARSSPGLMWVSQTWACAWSKCISSARSERGQWCCARLASSASSSLKAVSMTRWLTGQRAQALPEQRVGPGVAAEDPPALLAEVAYREAAGRNGVARRQHLDDTRAQAQALAHGNGAQLQHRFLGAGQAGEVGPDDAVEQVLAQRFASVSGRA